MNKNLDHSTSQMGRGSSKSLKRGKPRHGGPPLLGATIRPAGHVPLQDAERPGQVRTELGKSIFDLTMIFAVLARARPLRRPPTTPPLVLLMPPALNPPEPKLPPGLPTLEQLLKGLTRPTWGARAIPLPRYHQPAEPSICNSSSTYLQAHANSGAPAQQATPQAPLPSPLYPWMRSQFGQLTHEMIS